MLTLISNFDMDGMYCGPEAYDFEERACRVCGCTESDCSGCIERTGEACYWVTEDLCSACLGVAGEQDGILWFTISPDAGSELCLCSRCRTSIQEDEVPIRVFAHNGAIEARFCESCSRVVFSPGEAA